MNRRGAKSAEGSFSGARHDDEPRRPGGRAEFAPGGTAEAPMGGRGRTSHQRHEDHGVRMNRRDAESAEGAGRAARPEARMPIPAVLLAGIRFAGDGSGGRCVEGFRPWWKCGGSRAATGGAGGTGLWLLPVVAAAGGRVRRQVRNRGQRGSRLRSPRRVGVRWRDCQGRRRRRCGCGRRPSVGRRGGGVARRGQSRRGPGRSGDRVGG